MKILLAILASVFAFSLFYGSAKANAVENYDKNGGKVNEHLDTIHRKASTLEHYDEDYETEMYESEFLENVEHFKKRMPDSDARKAAYNKLAAKHGQKFHAAMANAGSKSNGSVVGKDPFYDSAAEFDLTITRISTNIALALTIPLFGSMHYNAKYLSIMGNYLPNGIVIDSIAVDALGNVVFSLKQVSTNLIDTISVGCTQIPYITFLSALNNNAMRLGKVRYSISDTTKRQQFSQPFEVYYKTLFGKHGGNGVSITSKNDPKYLDQGVRDVDNVIDVDSETAVIIGLINVAGFSVTLSSFVQRFDRKSKLK